MVTIFRLLTYEYPNKAEAVKDLQGRGVNQALTIESTVGKKQIIERFYITDQDALDVIAQLSPEVEFTHAPRDQYEL